MKRKLWLIIGLCLLLAACQTLLKRLRTSTPVSLTATETARLSATGWVIPLHTNTPTPAPTPTYTPTHTPAATTAPQPTQPTATQDAIISTSTPKPETPTASPNPVPQIRVFKASMNELDPGDTIVLSWQSLDATGVTLYLIPPSHHLPQSGWDLAATGSYTVTINPAARNHTEFLLYAYNAAGQGTSQGLTVYLRCPDPWFFMPEPNICPTAPLYSAAAEQHFEHGVMLWIGAQDRIIVLFDDKQFSPKYSVFRDEWEEGQPDQDSTLQPPNGLEQPIRGFGLVWRTHSEVRDRLGWATQGEVGFDTIFQNETRYKYNATYIRALDGHVWYLGPERSTWKKIEVQQ